MSKLAKSEVKTFSSEKELNSFLRSGVVSEIIALIPKMTHFVIFYIPVEIQVKKTKKGVENG
jgi:hypothetical protein